MLNDGTRHHSHIATLWKKSHSSIISHHLERSGMSRHQQRILPALLSSEHVPSQADEDLHKVRRGPDFLTAVGSGKVLGLPRTAIGSSEVIWQPQSS